MDQISCILTTSPIQDTLVVKDMFPNGRLAGDTFVFNINSALNPLSMSVLPRTAAGVRALLGAIRWPQGATARIVVAEAAAYSMVPWCNTSASRADPVCAYTTRPSIPPNDPLAAPGQRVLNTGQSVRPCFLEACDPRLPYRVLGDTVKFLTFEDDQGGSDLNGDGDGEDLVLQTFNVRLGAAASLPLWTGVGTASDRGAESAGGTGRPSSAHEERPPVVLGEILFRVLLRIF